MGSSYSPEPEAFIIEPDASSSVSLVAHGLNCIEQGHYAEGAAFFGLVRERLFPGQVQLTAALDALNKATASYLYAQQALQEASKRFAESDSEQQAQIAALKKLLPTLMEETENISHVQAQLRKNTKGHQSLRLLRLHQPSAGSSKAYQASSSEAENTLPALYITCFGRFEVRRFELSAPPIDLSHNLKGQAILRYLIAQPKHRETMDMLMTVSWPDDAPEAAHRKLRVAISALRRSLNGDVVGEPGGGYILCQGQVYQLNPSVVLRSDVDEFLALYQAGQQASDSEQAMAHYEKACHLYTGPFLTEDLYADWSFLRREELSKVYVVMCDKLAEFSLEIGCYKAAVKWASAILKVDRCDEEAHRQLIRAYAAQGRRSEALRQYQQCQRILRKELGVQPMPETQKLSSVLINGTDSPTGRENSMK